MKLTAGPSAPILEPHRKTRTLPASFTVRGEKHLQTTCGASDLNKYLDSHGIRYTLKDAVLKDDSIGECLTAYAVETHAVMLVMGAYGHARFREFFIGGATRSMLADPPLPLFLSH